MVDRRRLENIKQKIREGRMTFEDACFSLLSKDQIGQKEIAILLLVAEDIVFVRDSVDYIKEGEQSGEEDSTFSYAKVSSQLLFQKYEKLLNTKYPEVLHCFCAFLKELSVYEFGETIVGSGLFVEKGADVCQKILSTLQERSEDEIRMGYISVEILDMLLDIVKFHDKSLSLGLANSIVSLKRMEQTVQEILGVKAKLFSWFKMLKYIVKFVAKRGENLVVSMLKSLQKIATEKRFLYFTYYKNIPFFSRVLCDEIKIWAMHLMHPIDCYIDPAFPLLAGAFVIRPKQFDANLHKKEQIIVHTHMIISELLRYIPCANTRITHLYIEVGDTPREINVEKWNALYHIFNLDIIKCEIKLSVHSTITTKKFICAFFSSLIARDILSLCMYPEMPISEEVLSSMIENLRVESLILKELSYKETIGLEIEEFLWIISKQGDGMFKYLKELSITSTFQKKIVEGLQRITFSGIKKLLLDFMPMDGQQTRYIPKITHLINRNIFPILSEVTIKNSRITRQDFEFINEKMSLVQVKYNNFYCPSGSSYVDQNTYTFKQAENVSINAGIVFILPEKTVHKWYTKHSKDILSDCLICRSKFSEGSQDQVIILACGSVFHIGCITEAFSRKKNPCCPFCKRKIHLIMGLPMAVDTMFKPFSPNSFMQIQKSFPNFNQ
ncbi:hypothetical protein NEMIN01_1379 [Nematocida minor]|uniref:uncharacterized protein n=1 Tax=Nematocida minor TaxID=1912983 RepID=UPI0022204B2E|nr:uncharacterized protein NEMIN01_1379 [Nematocida minor]KAI5191110.1 hypothetical protein NEMIN01_1379 [Nematocida minor]